MKLVSLCDLVDDISIIELPGNSSYIHNYPIMLPNRVVSANFSESPLSTIAARSIQLTPIGHIRGYMDLAVRNMLDHLEYNYTLDSNLSLEDLEEFRYRRLTDGDDENDLKLVRIRPHDNTLYLVNINHFRVFKIKNRNVGGMVYERPKNIIKFSFPNTLKSCEAISNWSNRYSSSQRNRFVFDNYGQSSSRIGYQSVPITDGVQSIQSEITRLHGSFRENTDYINMPEFYYDSVQTGSGRISVISDEDD